jgi:hypothetical protein
MILAKTPSSGASTSMTALSVSWRDVSVCFAGAGKTWQATYNFEEDVAGDVGVTLAELPASDTTLCHGGAHGRHGHLGELEPPCGRVEAWSGRVRRCTQILKRQKAVVPLLTARRRVEADMVNGDGKRGRRAVGRETTSKQERTGASKSEARSGAGTRDGRGERALIEYVILLALVQLSLVRSPWQILSSPASPYQSRVGLRRSLERVSIQDRVKSAQVLSACLHTTVPSVRLRLPAFSRLFTQLRASPSLAPALFHARRLPVLSCLAM